MALEPMIGKQPCHLLVPAKKRSNAAAWECGFGSVLCPSTPSHYADALPTLSKALVSRPPRPASVAATETWEVDALNYDDVVEAGIVLEIDLDDGVAESAVVLDIVVDDAVAVAVIVLAFHNDAGARRQTQQRAVVATCAALAVAEFGRHDRAAGLARS